MYQDYGLHLKKTTIANVQWQDHYGATVVIYSIRLEETDQVSISLGKVVLSLPENEIVGSDDSERGTESAFCGTIYEGL